MQKDLRRQQYINKQKYEKKHPYKKQKQLTSPYSQIIDNSDLNEIITFMNQSYQKIITSDKNIQQYLNKIIIKRIEQLKKSWMELHKDRLILFLKENHIPFEYDHRLSLQANANNISYIKNAFYKSIIPIYTGKQYGKTQILEMLILDKKFQRHRYPFYCKDLTPSIDFRIDFKRMIKDTLFQCANFQDLVEDIQKLLKVKWNQKPIGK